MKKDHSYMRALAACAVFAFAGNVSAGPLTEGSPQVSAVNYLDIVSVDDRLVAVGDRGMIIYSDDQGSTWSEANSNTDVLLTAVCFADDQVGWAVGHDASIIKTMDGGQNWSLQYSDVAGGDSAQADAADDYAEEDYSDDIYNDDIYGDDIYGDDIYGDDIYGDDPYAYDEGGAQEVDTTGSPFLDVFCDSTKHAFAIGGFGYIVETTDGGDNWNKINKQVGNGDGWHLYGITQIPGTNSLVMAGEKGSLFKSTDLGKTWAKLPSPYDGSFFGVAAPRQNLIVAYGLQGNVWLSVDRGQTWRKLITKVSRGINGALPLDDGSIVFLASGGVVLVADGSMISAKKKTLPNAGSISAGVALENGVVVLASNSGLIRLNALTLADKE